MKEEGIDLKAAWAVVRKWWWLLVLGVVLGSVPVSLVNRGDPPVFKATTKIFVEGRQTPGLPSAGDIQASQNFAATYSDLIKTRPILDRVVRELKLPYGSDILVGKVDVVTSRSFILVSAMDADPSAAAILANRTAQVFIQDFQDRQVTQIARFQQLGGVQPSAADLAATFSSLSIIEDAVPPQTPLHTSNTRSIVLGAFVGLLGAGVLVLLFEHLDDRIKSPQELKERTGLPILATVPLEPTTNGRRPLIQSGQGGQTSLREAFRFLETNLEFATLDINQAKSVLVTSAGPLDGKTTTTANLGISLAKNGRSVILVDCDLRKPALHDTFGLQNTAGLTRVLLGEVALEEALAPTETEGLRVLTSGPMPPEPTQLLSSPKMRELIERLETKADMVVIDSAPVLAVADPLLLVPAVGAVLMVVGAKSNSRDAVMRSVESVRQAKPKVLATVVNEVSPSQGRYYPSYYYAYRRTSYGGTKKNGSAPGGIRHARRRLLDRVLRRTGSSK